MTIKGNRSYLKCVTEPNGDIAFTGSHLGSDDVTISVSGTAHKRNYKVNGIPVELPPKVEGQWGVYNHQGVIVSGNTDGTVEGRHEFDPEVTLNNAEMMVHRAAKICNERQGKHNFRPARMDFNLF
jgi:hypothetical protein